MEQEKKKEEAKTKDFEACLSAAQSILSEDKNDDRQLLKSKFAPLALSCIKFIRYFYQELGVAGLRDGKFQEYLQRLDLLLIAGNADKSMIGKKL